jgi:methylthioribose-1-phosphate isomerase
MKELLSTALKQTSDGKLLVLDQTQLPKKELWLEAQSPDDMIQIIYELKTRGAPLIGVAASLSLAQYVRSGCTYDEFKAAAEALRKARPTAVNLMNAIDRLLNQAQETNFEKDSVISLAEQIFEEDVNLCQRMAVNGAELVQEGESILTHCNTGGLATVGVGTALGVIQKAHEQKKNIHVFVDETRPLLQGGRLTTWELEKRGIPYTLICDNMAAHLMQSGRVQRAFVGADRVARNGDFANKIGTYALSIICKYHGVDFHPVAPVTTVDFECESGKEIPIEERKEFEVRGVRGAFGEIEWSPGNAPVYNPAFDVTPVENISSFVFDSGVYSGKDIKQSDFVEKLKKGV